jgi:prophage maintenance system killer protein
LALFTVLRLEGYKLTATEEEAYKFTIKVSTGEVGFEEISAWIKKYTAI